MLDFNSRAKYFADTLVRLTVDRDITAFRSLTCSLVPSEK